MRTERYWIGAWGAIGRNLLVFYSLCNKVSQVLNFLLSISQGLFELYVCVLFCNKTHNDKNQGLKTWLLQKCVTISQPLVWIYQGWCQTYKQTGGSSDSKITEAGSRRICILAPLTLYSLSGIFQHIMSQPSIHYFHSRKQLPVF